MLKIVIVGDSNSGKATFLGLLYMTQVSSGSDKADEFRFSTPYESLDALSYVFQQLMSGTFPDQVTKQGIRRIHFQLGYRRTGGGMLSRLRGREWTRESSVRFLIMGAKDDEFSSVVLGTPIEEERWTDIHDVDAVVILVDSTKLGVPDEKKKAGPMSAYDGALASLLGLMRRRSEPETRRQIYPIFLFSKFDRVNPEALSATNLGTDPPKVDEPSLRATYAEALLKANLPKTLVTIRYRDRDHVPFASPVPFFLWVRTKAEPGQPEKIQFGRSGDGGWKLQYSNSEYLAVLEYLREIVATQRKRTKLSRR